MPRQLGNLSESKHYRGRTAKVNITEEEHVVLFTGYQKQDIMKLGSDARNCAVLNSAYSSTECS